MLTRIIERAIGRAVRPLMRRLTAGSPSFRFDDVELLMADNRQASTAPIFFERTVHALESAHRHAPASYDQLRRDIVSIVLWAHDVKQPYNRFLKALVVGPSTVFDADEACYAAWLLGSSKDEPPAQVTTPPTEFMSALEPVERDRVEQWLVEVDGRQRAAPDYEPEDMSRICSLPPR